jgi:hypothetical protein
MKNSNQNKLYFSATFEKISVIKIRNLNKNSINITELFFCLQLQFGSALHYYWYYNLKLIFCLLHINLFHFMFVILFYILLMKIESWPLNLLSMLSYTPTPQIFIFNLKILFILITEFFAFPWMLRLRQVLHPGLGKCPL